MDIRKLLSDVWQGRPVSDVVNLILKKHKEETGKELEKWGIDTLAELLEDLTPKNRTSNVNQTEEDIKKYILKIPKRR